MYTRKGDGGFTTINNLEVRKSSDIINIIGLVDTNIVYICDARRLLSQAHYAHLLLPDLDKIIKIFYNIGSILSGYLAYDANTFNIKYIEDHINDATKILPELKNFILPCSTENCAALDKCRVYIRNFEIELFRYTEDNEIFNDYEEMLSYINRLSSYFFAISRLSMHFENKEEIYLKDIG